MYWDLIGGELQLNRSQPIRSDPLSPTMVSISTVDRDRGSGAAPAGLDAHVPLLAREVLNEKGQKGIPDIARDSHLLSLIEDSVKTIPTSHELVLGDARRLSAIADNTVHLVVTSPPYWNLKVYPEDDGQLGLIDDYESFLYELDKVWSECFRVLVPGARMVIVVGDVLIPRRRFGRHVVYPLHASIQEHCRRIGFDNLSPIIWSKIGNITREVQNGSSYLGKPFEPNGIIKNDIEYILFQRKPGGYRSPSADERILSVIPAALHKEWFQQILSLGGASTRDHPAPFPIELAERMIRMFSFVGDNVLDPFMGTGTTNCAAAKWGRDSVGYEVESRYFEGAVNRLQSSIGELFPKVLVSQSTQGAVIPIPK